MSQAASFKRLNCPQVAAILTSQDLQILDSRDTGAFERSHLPGAVQLNQDTFGKLAMTLPKSMPILIYCYHGNASQEYARMFADFRFTDVSDLIGGYAAWQQYEQTLTSLTGTTNQAPIPASLRVWLTAQGFADDNINATITNQTTPLMQAARLGDVAMVRALLDAGADITVRNADGNQALWLACFADQLEMIQMFAEAGMDVDNQNDNGATCLMYAASAGKTEVVYTLLNVGADITLKSADDFTALDMAANEGSLYLLRAAEKAMQGYMARHSEAA